MDQWKAHLVSLNGQLLVGPTVHPPLNDVLIRFRKHPYVLTTDVSKMYCAVTLTPEDRDFPGSYGEIKILTQSWTIKWRESSLELQVLRSWQQTRHCVLQKKMNKNSPLLQRPWKNLAMLTMAFHLWKQSKKPSHFIVSFKTSLTEEDSNFTNGLKLTWSFELNLPRD